ncbi:MAG TPA: exopolysaccharide biosynthesis polyprenyl glycosylphosphotransferase [Candidatus Eisenbacteria bacterium]|nr:exopolysaccharide biosynthesis polyprenyl glycosylphosphotransferase [Candidatus Eisenbacteria bacterium]
MIRLFNTYFPTRTLLLTLTEAILVTTGFVVAVLLSSGTADDAKIYLLYENGAGRIGLVVLVFLVLMYYFDLYNSAILTNRREVVTRLVGVLGTTFVALAVLYYTFPDASLGGNVLWAGILMVAVVVPVWRSCFFALNRSVRFAERILIYGDGPLASPLMDAIGQRPELGLRVSGYVGSEPQIAGIPVVRGDELTEYVKREDIRRIIVTMGDRRGKLDVSELLKLKASGVLIQDGPEYYETVTGKIPLESLRLSWLLFSPGFHVRPALRLYKRAFSFTFGLIGVVLASPVMGLAALAIRLDSEGPIIFRQKRVGEFGMPFTVYKFRTMYDGDKVPAARAKNNASRDENHIGTPPAHDGDPRITRVGKWLRRTRLDELPQLFNIVKGDISFVGPRPVPPHEEEQCAAVIPFYKERWLIKPGATGWAQINRGYNATIEDHKDKLAYDLFYIKNVSIGLDIYILFATLKILLLGRGGR